MKKLLLFLLLTVQPLFAQAKPLLQRFEQSPELQTILENEVTRLKQQDANLAGATLHIAVVNLADSSRPRFAHINGDRAVYPASVIKFVYLIAAYKWKELGRLQFSAELRRDLAQMIIPSSNQATQKVFRRLTRTSPGPALTGKEYDIFKQQRLSVKSWLQSVGITDLHAVHPTYDGGTDLFGRDTQFINDKNIPGGYPHRNGTAANRQSMTALGTAKLLTLLNEGALLTPEHTKAVLSLMQRDLQKQPYQIKRIAGGAARVSPKCITSSKTGTWGPIYADAGVVTLPSGREVVIAIFIDRTVAYRGTFVADLSEAILRQL